MALERTLAMIKPDMFEKGHVGEIITMYENAGFRIVKLASETDDAMLWEQFYEEHRGKSFFEELTSFMASGPCMQLVLEAEDAVAKLRKLNGATRPSEAAEGTIRKIFGDLKNGPRNAVHGSDSLESAKREIDFFFG